jgi:hypothetical protein
MSSDLTKNSSQYLGAYLSVIGAHTTLSIYIAALQDHASRSTEAAVLQSCLFAGLQTCRASISGRLGLTYLVNNAALMVAYAAAFSLKVCVSLFRQLLSSNSDRGVPFTARRPLEGRWVAHRNFYTPSYQRSLSTPH